jgi:threonine dehydratase
MTEQTMPTLHDIIAARPNVYRHLRPTPLYHYPTLSDLVGTDVWVKHENHQPVGAFKVRGGLNLAAHLNDGERRSGLFTASTGNHGQSIAYAARAFGIQATIAVPEGANPGKVAAMRGLGAEILVHGADFDQAREWITEMAREQGGRFVGPTEELLICGVGTYALEILEELPQVDVIIVPVGAGSGVCGTSIVAKSINPQIEVIGAQSAQAPAMQLSWKSGKLVSAEMNTFAEGVATRVPFENTQRIMRHYLDDFVLVEDRDIEGAILLMLEHTHNLVEGAGAIPLAAALQLRPRLAGRKVVLIASGGNLSLDKLSRMLAGPGGLSAR